MIMALVVAVVLEVPRPTEEELLAKSIPEHWAYVLALRESRARDMVRWGMEEEVNHYKRAVSERVLYERLGGRTYLLRPGVRLVPYADAQAGGYLREMHDHPEAPRGP
jgi:hypothetical protein